MRARRSCSFRPLPSLFLEVRERAMSLDGCYLKSEIYIGCRRATLSALNKGEVFRQRSAQGGAIAWSANAEVVSVPGWHLGHLVQASDRFQVHVGLARLAPHPHTPKPIRDGRRVSPA